MARYSIIVLLAVLVLAGCAPKVHVMLYQDVLYEPSDHVEVFRTLQPERPYIELAELWIDSDGSDAIRQLCEQGRQLGADAIILMPDMTDAYARQRVQTGTSIRVGPGGHGSVGFHLGQSIDQRPRRVWAIAIKYQQRGSQTDTVLPE